MVESNKFYKKLLRMVDGHFTVRPLGNGLYKVKSIDRYQPYKGVFKLVKRVDKYSYFEKVGND